MDSTGMDFEATMDAVLKNIYTSCDSEGDNQVPAAKLIEFISPYLLQDEIAFESLKIDLDPEDQNVLVSSEKFYEVMNKWAKKIANSNDEDDEFNRTPSQLDEIDDKELPFIQSTPRASFGQKLLSCEELLNLSNVTTDLAAICRTNEESTVGLNKQWLQEEVKRLEHQLKQVLAEMDMMKNQVALTEEHNENLQTELTRCRTRLMNEQQTNEHLQRDKFQNDELKDELNSRQNEMENLTKKLHQYEKDTSYMSMLVQQLESENTKLTERCEEFSAREQKLKKDLFDVKTDLEVKDQELSMITRLNEELKQKLNKEQQNIEDLRQENDLLDYKKNTLEKRLSSRRYSSYCPYKSNNKNTPNQGSATVPLYVSPCISDKELFFFNSPHIREILGSPISPCVDSPLYCKKQLNPFFFPKTPEFSSIPNNKSNVQDQSYEEDFSLEAQLETSKNSSNQQVSLQMELYQTGQFDINNREDGTEGQWSGDESMNFLTLDNEQWKEKLKNLNIENEKLKAQIEEANKQVNSLSKDLEKIEAEKQNFHEKIQYLEVEKRDLENRIKNMEIRYPELLNKNHDKIQELEDCLSKVRKEYANLQTQCKMQEQELTEIKNRFNFEIPFKNLQIELNQKNKDLEELRQSCFNYKSLIQRLTNTNLELDQKLKETMEALERYQIKSKEVEKTNESAQLNSVQAQSQLQMKTEHLNQLILVNKSFADKIHYLERELQHKLSEVAHLKDRQKEDMSIKNTMWRNYKTLEHKSDNVKDKLSESEKSIKELKEEYDKLLATYNDEVTKNCELCEQIRKQKEELCDAMTKYQEENDKNVKLSDKIKELINETIEIKANHTNSNKQLLMRISEYEIIEEEYDNKIRKLESSNSNLIMDLQRENNNNIQKIAEYESKIKVNDETIKNLELVNSSLKADLERERKQPEKKDNDESFGDSISFPCFSEKASDSKTRSFEKQQLVIEKLRIRIKDLEIELQKEKSRSITFKTELEETHNTVLKLEERLEQLQRESILERQTSVNRIHELTEKNKSQEEFHDLFGNISEEKIKSISRTLAQAEAVNQKLQLELERKDNLLKQQLEVIEINMASNYNINKTIEDLNSELSKRDIELKKITIEDNSLRNLYDNSEKKLQEHSLRVFELEREVNSRCEEVKLLSTCVQEKNDTIQNLKIHVAELEKKFTDISLELSEKENRFAGLLEEKENLQEMLSKTDGRIEEKINSSRTVLQCIEVDAGMMGLLSETRREYEDTSKTFLENSLVLQNCNRELLKALLMVVKSWRVEFQKDARFKCIPPLEGENSLKNEESLFCLRERITIAVMILEILATKAPMENSGNSPEFLDACSINNNKTLKKFTLRPARLVVGRPVSPDSPCLGIGEECGDNSKPTKTLDSPDSRTTEGGNNFTDLIDDVFVEDTTNAAKLFSPLGLSFDDAFPHLTDSFLEKIGLHEDGTKQTLSAPETERLFATFAIQIALDSTDIKERLEIQRDACEKQHKRLLHLMRDISMRLREHKCIGAMDSIKPVFVLLEDVRYLLREIMQTSGQFGILNCEHRMMRCWNMVTNYMAMLKKESSLSPSKRKQIMFDKGVGTLNLPEDVLENVVEPSIESQKPIPDDEFQSQNVEDLTDDMVGYRCEWFSSVCKTLPTLLVFLTFFGILGLLSIHWQCQMSTDSHICPLDTFIKKINIGTPPY